MSPFNDTPARMSGFLSVAFAAIVVVSSGPYAVLSVAFCAVGTLTILLGLFWASRAAVTLGSVGLLFGSLTAGVQSAPTVVVLFGVTATVLAWDAGQTAIEVGEQLGEAAETRRLELVHFLGSAAVGTVTVLIGYLALLAGAGGQPTAVLLGLLVAVVFLLAALRRQTSVISST